MYLSRKHVDCKNSGNAIRQLSVLLSCFLSISFSLPSWLLCLSWIGFWCRHLPTGQSWVCVLGLHTLLIHERVWNSGDRVKQNWWTRKQCRRLFLVLSVRRTLCCCVGEHLSWSSDHTRHGIWVWVSIRHIICLRGWLRQAWVDLVGKETWRIQQRLGEGKLRREWVAILKIGCWSWKK